MVVCCAAQEVGAPHLWVYYRKNNNAIFTYMYLCAAFTKPDDFCCRDALHRQCTTFQIVTKSHKAFPRYKLSKIGLVSLFFFFFLSRCYSCHKVKMHNLSALKFGTQIVGVTVHLGTKFSWNTVNTCKVMCDYSRKICYHAYRVNHAWHEAKNWPRGGLTIEPQTFCGLNEIKLKIIKIQRKNQQCVIITRSRIANKIPLLSDKPFRGISWKLVHGWINQLWRTLQKFQRIEFQSSEL